MNKNRPSITICITTYNVSSFIKECIESALNQKVNAQMDILIADDCSTDDTFNICQSFKEKYPHIIHLCRNKYNLGYAKNYMQAISMCQGEYIAILDGDDYWTDLLKLQKQIDFLDNNPEFTMCHHDGWIQYPDGRRTIFKTKPCTNEYGLDHLLNDVNNWNSSVMYRNVFHGKFPSWLVNVIAPDHPLHLLHAAKGGVKFFPEPMGVYRMHENNISKMWINDRAHELSRSAIFCCRHLKKELPKKYHAVINLGAARHFDLIAGHYWKKRSYLKFFANVFRGYLLCPVRSISEYKDSYYHLFRQP